MRAGVLVASPVKHGLHLARALQRDGLLAGYLGPVVFDAATAGPRAPARRRMAGVDDVPLRRLWTSDAATQLAHRFAPNAWLRHAPGATVLDAELAARLTLRTTARTTARTAGSTSPAVLHWHTNSLRLTPWLARRRGLFLVADHRALHPLEEHPDGSPLRSADIAELELADLVVVNSEAARANLARHGVDEGKLRVVELGVEAPAVGAPVRPLADRDPTLLFVGEIGERKGVDVLLGALAGIPAGIREIVLVGPGRDRQLERRLLEADARVRLLGALPHQAVLVEMRRARLLCLPSPAEAFGLVVPEALSVGTPVVVSSGCGAADLVRRPEDGAVFAAGSAPALVDAVARVLAEGGHPRLPGSSTWDAYEARVRELYALDVLPALDKARHG